MTTFKTSLSVKCLFDEPKCNGAGEVLIHYGKRCDWEDADFRFALTRNGVVIAMIIDMAPEKAWSAPSGANEGNFNSDFHLLTYQDEG